MRTEKEKEENLWEEMVQEYEGKGKYLAQKK